MRVIEPYAQWEPFSLELLKGILPFLEKCGRVCYKSEDKILADSAAPFIKRKIMNAGHESVIEHVTLSARFVCDRGVTHELVRHRLASYSQESTRYCDYGNEGTITIILPLWFKDAHKKHSELAGQPDTNDVILQQYKDWAYSCEVAERMYMRLLASGQTPQQARAVLPNSLKTEIVCSANLREWRHIFKLRTAGSAHPQMRQVMIPLLREIKSRLPVIFDDVVAFEGE